MNANCANICLSNELLIEIDKYAKEVDMSRLDVIQLVIMTLKRRGSYPDNYYRSQYPFFNSPNYVARCVHCFRPLESTELFAKQVHGKMIQPLCQSCCSLPVDQLISFNENNAP